MKRNTFKRCMSGLLAFLMCFTALVVFVPAASAATTTSEAFYLTYPRENDAAYVLNHETWGHPEKTFMNGWGMDAMNTTPLHTVGSYNGQICYCIEPGVDRNIGDSFTGLGEEFWNNYPGQYNRTIEPQDIKLLLGRIMQFGYQGNISDAWVSQNPADADKIAHAYATQILIWETIVGERDSDFNHVSPGSCDAVKSIVCPGHPLRSQIYAHYDSMEKSMKSFSVLPSFMSKTSGKAATVELEWDGSAYRAVLADSNNVLANYTFSSDVSGISFSVSGNKLTVSSSKAPSGEVTVTASRAVTRKGLLVWTDGKYGPDGGIQDTVTYNASVSDPVKAYVKFKTNYGSTKITKTSEDGKIEGVSFTVAGEGVSKTVKTNAKGEVTVDNLKPGSYTVTEQNGSTYVPQETKKITVTAGQTAAVTFSNVLRRGSLVVTKTSEDGIVEGVKFHLSGTSSSGQKVDEYAVTGKDGKAYFNDVLIGTGYTLEETGTAVRYVVPEKQTVSVEWNNVTSKSFSNVLKKFNVTVRKTDAEKGSAQGSASLADAKYGLYKGDELIDTYVTDRNGCFTTAYYACGSDWSVREVEPSEGYLLDTTVYHVGAEAKLYSAEKNSAPELTVTEQAMKGSIAVIKHTDNGKTQIETPEAGAVFTVFLKSAGSYDAADESERDRLICDENGFAQTKALPFGVYTVHQESGWDGRELIKDFDVSVSENGEIYRYLLNDSFFESYVKIVKIDAESGSVIPYSGAGFRIYKPDGEPVTMTFTYPSLMTVDTFYTNESGILITPERLEYGKGYSLVEVTAPYGYVLDTEPVTFDVTQDDSADDGGVTVVSVTKADSAQKGIIKISKTGEVFSTVAESDGTYQPVYEVKGLSGAVYEICAAEDICTPDGTLRYSAGEVVDTVTTGEDGTAESKALYLGQYDIRETEAPYGMVINNEISSVLLQYAGQEIEVADTSVSLTNERQKAAVTFTKIMAQDEVFGNWHGDEFASVTFGLYAAEDLTAGDGSVIPADGLIEVFSVDENGTAEVKTDLPFGKYYVKEISTDCRYILSDTKYEFSFDYAGQDNVTVDLTVNDGNPIVNELIYGEIRGIKKDDNGNGLGGAVIGLFTVDGTEPVVSAVSADDGSFSFSGVPYGEYVVREISAPEAYVLDDKPYEVTIGSDGDVVEIEITNMLNCGNVELTKVDADYPEHHLAGAEFEVYQNGVLIGKMKELDGGVYRMDGLPYGDYTLKETKAPAGFCIDDNVYDFSIRENGETVIVENEAGKGFINKPQVGDIRIEKISEDGVLKGFTFRVEGTDVTGNAFSHEYVTDKKGQIHIEGLRIGDYVISEVADKTNEKYFLPDDVTVTVHEGKTVVAKFNNKLKPEKPSVPVVPDIPKTGDDTNMTLWACLAAAALLGIIGASYITFRKKEDDRDER